MIHVENIQKRYGSFEAVKGISFEAQKGEVLAILGPNGAGKSTLLKSICGLVKPSSGSILIDGKTHEKDAVSIKQMMGYMPEESSLYEDMNAYDYLFFFAELYNLREEVARQRINHLLNSLKLKVDKNLVLGNMSKGMKRKVLIARSLINNPKLLVYDEPASGLDPATTNFILDYIIDLKKQGKTVLITAHNLGHIERIADKVIIMNHGKMIINDGLRKIKKEYGKNYSIHYLKNGKTKKISFNNSGELNRFVKKLVQHNLEIEDIHADEKSLEEIFMMLTQ